ncbi:hypothetical protein VOLCADRAFT_98259 [Volvox carteri f. nagariensis]|uniref:Uncharacterized protein n=1 Tax=Volvox carteri f. nagariensis TaxID=3068 RepID=D8UEZ6_VOLCA|nr:uncharacterized protein VOLCADRAFT_98259 [Volvox carteri f. nagariensis]EFJ41729.1 hypothetical protein VOLCADRAFT_98259 [Volvox carteri f. nagariensis]|eukprot:XP_002957231.1 hypothetical protein VOLCADRAFT_98259 [Volvox carteri f. nagariensis]
MGSAAKRQGCSRRGSGAADTAPERLLWPWPCDVRNDRLLRDGSSGNCSCGELAAGVLDDNGDDGNAPITAVAVPEGTELTAAYTMPVALTAQQRSLPGEVSRSPAGDIWSSTVMNPAATSEDMELGRMGAPPLPPPPPPPVEDRLLELLRRRVRELGNEGGRRAGRLEATEEPGERQLEAKRRIS